MVSERGIEVDPDKIRAILDMPAPSTEREIRDFLALLLGIGLGYSEIEILHDRKSIRGSIVVDHLGSLPISTARVIDDDFLDEELVAVTGFFRIDGHQAQPVSVQGSTPHDSTIPPPPPSGHTIQQDHTVPPPPPPLIQSAP
ncbi:hypothetical protein CK203_037965 [Vitis vinifera]|uniref:Reverse transcriptase domain-containing protein n=1 Tax=Vitis vinifera TaxID=29760 RepID=A0A438HNX7_VITVI|nr:hypothetical protein CK203_037965 [Vitis vinifera]